MGDKAVVQLSERIVFVQSPWCDKYNSATYESPLKSNLRYDLVVAPT